MEFVEVRESIFLREMGVAMDNIRIIATSKASRFNLNYNDIATAK